ncbi:EpsG family protein [Acinetobacter seifertii]|uniref:EpsG family protein n=1 Tax=Acinetobacter seifertii TaxID=1530123 RepID=A0ABX8KZC0_9GAMM|nr:EpsG family protein [Acinetobacter seifertii]QXB44911.1 EpsG family protein [Acinetobacter seifertii]
MSNFKVSKNSIITFFTIIVVFFIALTVSNRGPYVDNDYQAYEVMFENYSTSNVEPVYKIISMFLNSWDLDFSSLLFLFCFFSILLKIYSFILAKKIKLIGNEGFTYFIFIYFFCFFALWDLTQIRASLAVSFLMLSFFSLKPYKKAIFKILALLTHYSISFVLLFELIYSLVRRNIYLHLLFSLILCVCLFYLVGLTPYVVYDASSYSEKFNPISFKNLFIILTFFVVRLLFNRKDDNRYYIEKLSALSISLLIMYYVFGFKYPSIAIRVADYSLFFSVLSLVFVRNNGVLNIYKYVSLIVMAIYFTYIFYLSDTSIIHLDEWGIK